MISPERRADRKGFSGEKSLKIKEEGVRRCMSHLLFYGVGFCL
jgi:hypothetical protein